MSKILFAVIALIVFILFNMAITFLLAYYNRKCHKCGRRMKYMYETQNEEGESEFAFFYCPHCKTLEKVDVSELIAEQHDDYEL